MSANVVLFKIKLEYVKVHVLAYFEGGLRGTFMVLRAGGGGKTLDAFAPPPERFRLAAKRDAR